MDSYIANISIDSITTIFALMALLKDVQDSNIPPRLRMKYTFPALK